MSGPLPPIYERGTPQRFREFVRMELERMLGEVWIKEMIEGSGDMEPSGIIGGAVAEAEG